MRFPETEAGLCPRAFQEWYVMRWKPIFVRPISDLRSKNKSVLNYKKRIEIAFPIGRSILHVNRGLPTATYGRLDGPG